MFEQENVSRGGRGGVGGHTLCCALFIRSLQVAHEMLKCLVYSATVQVSVFVIIIISSSKMLTEVASEERVESIKIIRLTLTFFVHEALQMGTVNHGSSQLFH